MIICYFHLSGKEFPILSRDQFWLEEEKTEGPQVPGAGKRGGGHTKAVTSKTRSTQSHVLLGVGPWNETVF